jgi:hypothetical protein
LSLSTLEILYPLFGEEFRESTNISQECIVGGAKKSVPQVALNVVFFSDSFFPTYNKEFSRCNLAKPIVKNLYSTIILITNIIQ